jgi:hypothetical protein
MSYEVELDAHPGREQVEESLTVVYQDGRRDHMLLHEYERVYAVPGLYEEVVQRRLECASPRTLADALVDTATEAGVAPSALRVFDLGAGNGVVGEELAARGVGVLVASDNIVEAREAANRDRPALYREYLVGDIADLPEAPNVVQDLGLNALVAAGALGLGHISATTFARFWESFPPGAFFAVTVKESLAASGASDFGDWLAELEADDRWGRVVLRERFRHRLTMAGEELYYLAVVARKA